MYGSEDCASGSAPRSYLRHEGTFASRKNESGQFFHACDFGRDGRRTGHGTFLLSKAASILYTTNSEFPLPAPTNHIPIDPLVRTRKCSSTTTSEKYSDFHLLSDTTRKHYDRLNAQDAADIT